MLFVKVADDLARGVKVGKKYYVAKKVVNRTVEALRSIGILCEVNDAGHIEITGVDRLSDDLIDVKEIRIAYGKLRQEYDQKYIREQARERKAKEKQERAMRKIRNDKPKIVRDLMFYKFKLMTTGVCIFTGEDRRKEFLEWLADVKVVPLSYETWINGAGVTMAKFTISVTPEIVRMASDYIPNKSTIRKPKKITKKDKDFMEYFVDDTVAGYYD